MATLGDGEYPYCILELREVRTRISDYGNIRWDNLSQSILGPGDISLVRVGFLSIY